MALPKLDQGRTPTTLSSDYRFPASRKVYTPGRLHPDVRVPHREIALSPTHIHNSDRTEVNAPLRVYDTSGPYTDPDAIIDVRQGLTRLREPWIRGREGVAYTEGEPSYRPIAGHSEAGLPMPPKRMAIRGSGSVTQLQQARAGIVTPEMEFIALRENQGRDRAQSVGQHPGHSFGAAIPEVITPEFVRAEVARGRAIIPSNINHPEFGADDHRA